VDGALLLHAHHSVLPNAVALGTHKFVHLFNATGEGVTKALDRNVLKFLQTDCAVAIPNGIRTAGIVVEQEVTCFMHITGIWEGKPRKGTLSGELLAPVAQEVKGVMYLLHLGTLAAIHAKAFDAFDRHFRTTRLPATQHNNNFQAVLWQTAQGGVEFDCFCCMLCPVSLLPPQMPRLPP